MTVLTTNLRTHKAILKDWTELQLTKEQYENILNDKENKKYWEFIIIKCPDTWKVEYCWEIWQIKQLIEKEYSNAKYKVICDYWNKHDLINWQYNCDCKEKYWFSALDFKIYMRDKYWIIYMQDTTDDHKREFYLLNKKQNANKEYE